MKTCRSCLVVASTLVLVLFISTPVISQDDKADPLPSWNDGATKKAILDFVGKVTKKGSPQYVPVEQRIATFDNDGTLWSEQPLYFQLAFAIDRVKALAPKHPIQSNHSLWVRPKKMFMETVTVDGKEVPRFSYLGDER